MRRPTAAAGFVAGAPRWGTPVGLLRATLDREADRLFLWLPVLMGVGIGLYFALPAEPPLWLALLPLVPAMAARILMRRGLRALIIPAALIAMTAGFALAKVRTETVRGPVLAEEMRRAEITGWLELVEPRLPEGQRLTIRVAAIAGLAEGATPYRVRVRTLKAEPGLKAGDPVRLTAALGPPGGPALPGAYDFARRAWYARIGAVGFTRAGVTAETSLGPAPLSLRLWSHVERVRQAIGARIVAALPGETGAIANALITGERGGISEVTNQIFRDSGLYHILSISGLHMVIMAGTVFFAVRLVLAAFPVVALRFPIKKWAAALASIAALLYLLISGAEFATERSWIMISLMFLAVMLDRPAIALRNVALAALALLIVYPECLIDVGFQMSFAAVVMLVAAYEAIRDRARPQEAGGGYGFVRLGLLALGGIILSTLIASLAVAPIAAYHFHKTQQYAILGNLLAVPIVNLIVMPMALVALLAMPLGLEAGPLKVMGLGIEATIVIAKYVAALPGAVGALPAYPLAALLVMVAGALWFALWRTRWRFAGLIAVAGGLALATTGTRPDLLVGLDGTLVAVRAADGSLATLIEGRGRFELERWLEHDGAPVGTRPVSRGLACDQTACVATLKGRRVAIVRQPSALAEECARADILVLRVDRPAWCARPGAVVIDRLAVARGGTHALRVTDRGIEIETVATWRGERPWAAAKSARLLARHDDRPQFRRGSTWSGRGRSTSTSTGDDDPGAPETEPTPRWGERRR